MVKNQSNKPKSTIPFLPVLHFVILMFALFLSFKCNRGFHFGAFLMACCCPQLYIVYSIAIHNGIC